MPKPECVTEEIGGLTSEALSEENRRLRRQNFALAEKLERLSNNVNALVHDLRNPLTVIIGHAQSSRLTEGLDLNITRSFDVIEERAKKANSIVSDTVESIIRLKEPKPEVIVAADFLQFVVDDNTQLMKTAGVQLVFLVPKEPIRIYADPQKLSRVYNTLILNACHAVEGCKNKRVIIKTATAKENFIVYLEDSGKGMSPETQAKCMNPGFSTKKGTPFQSTGMGLSIALETMKEAGGNLWLVKNEVGVGSIFAASLPIYRN